MPARGIARTLQFALVSIGAASVLAGCGDTVDAGGLSITQRNDAQLSFNALQGSNIPTVILNMTSTAGQIPAACRVHLVSKHPSTFRVYIFWVPYVPPAAYSWLTMTISKDASLDTFKTGSAPSIQPGGLGIGGKIAPFSGGIDYDRPLTKLGPVVKAQTQRVFHAHAGDVYSKPDDPCQVLLNGYLKMLPYKPAKST